MRWTASGAWLLATLLAGCVSAPAQPPLRAQLPSAYPEAPPAQEALPTAALDTRWTLYNDPQLDALEREALKGAPDADAALARLAAAKATLATAVMGFNPQGAFTAAGATEHTHLVDGNVDLAGLPASIEGQSLKVPLVALGDTGSYDAAFNVSWEIDLFGRRRATERVARADLATARFQFEGARASLAAAVADNLFAARGLAREAEAAEDALTQEQALAQLVERQVQAGLAPASDLGRSRAALAKAQAQAVALRGQADAQRRSLLVLIGRGTAPLADLPLSTAASAPPTLPATTPGDLLARRPDVREAEARLRSALGAVAVDRLELFPRFNLLPGVGIDEVHRPGNTYATSLWSVGLGLAVPVLDRPRLLALVRAQNARAAQAAADYEKSVQTAYGEASSVLGQLSADERQLALLTSAQASAKATLDSTRVGYQAGMSDARSAIVAEQAWSAAARDLAQAQTQALRRSVQAFKALGGGWTPEPQRVGRGQG
jgi:NodT family efflux transporter outer membrane factor (OMF) lipoprotein